MNLSLQLLIEELWRLMERCSADDLRRVFLTHVRMRLADLTSLERGLEAIRTDVIEWLLLQDDKTVGAFLGGLHAVKPHAGFDAFATKLFGRPLPPSAPPGAPAPPPAPAAAPSWEDDHLPCGHAFADRENFRRATAILQAPNARRVLLAQGPEQVGKSRCHFYIRARLRATAGARLAYLSFDESLSRSLKYDGSYANLVGALLREWNLPSLDLPAGTDWDSVDQAFQALEDRVRAHLTVATQLWVIFDQFPNGHQEGKPTRTDELIAHLAWMAAIQELNLRVVLLGYHREDFLRPSADAISVVLSHLSVDELRTFFHQLRNHCPNPPPPGVDDLLRNYRQHPPGSAYCRQQLRTIPELIDLMRA